MSFSCTKEIKYIYTVLATSVEMSINELRYELACDQLSHACDNDAVSLCELLMISGENRVCCIILYYTVGHKKRATFIFAITLAIVDRFH